MAKNLTLRQIEVVKAVMIAGSIAGAARLLNVAQPGVSRTMKHIEASLGFALFVREGGRFVPAPEARDVFIQLQAVQKQLENLQLSVARLERGQGVELSIGSVPSLGHVMAPAAVARLHAQMPDLRFNIELLKIEEAIEYLLLGRGELVLLSAAISHPSIVCHLLAKGELVCVASPQHPLARKASVTAADIAKHPLIGIEPDDPYGALLVRMFHEQGLAFEIPFRTRFGTTVMALVRHNLGVSVLDSFSTARIGEEDGGLVTIPIRPTPEFEAYVALRRDKEISSFASGFVDVVREVMVETAQG